MNQLQLSTLKKNTRHHSFLAKTARKFEINQDEIVIPIYIFKSRSKNPKPDPILYTVGGPGYTSMRASQYMQYYRYLDDRDFILFEQRGTQYAQPSLDCPEWAKAVYKSNLPNFDTYVKMQNKNMVVQAELDE